MTADGWCDRATAGGNETGDVPASALDAEIVYAIRVCAGRDHSSLDPLRTQLYLRRRALLEEDAMCARSRDAATNLDLHAAFDRLHQPSEGFIYDLVTGQEKTVGFFITRHVDRARTYDTSGVQVEHLRQFVETNADLLTRDGNLLGARRDEGTGLVSFTISVQLDSAEAARLEVTESGQVAFYDAQVRMSVLVNSLSSPQSPRSHIRAV